MATKAKTAANPKMKPRGRAFPKGVSGNPLGAAVTEARFSTYIQRALDMAKTVEEYDEVMNQAQAIALDFVGQYWKAGTVQEKATVLDRLADRTEGKPQQKVDHTTLGEKLPTPIYGGLSTENVENDTTTD